jgi:hypothetical protein
MASPVFTCQTSLKNSFSSKRFFIKASVLVLGSGPLVHAQNAAAVNAAVVNRSARMRALSQRLVKLKTQQFLQVSPDATSDNIMGTEKLISSHLQFLSSSIPPTSRNKMDALSRLVSSLMVQAKVSPTVESLIQTNALSMEVLKAADELTAEMQTLSKVKAVAVVNLAGRQRMLSQRMAKNYFLLAARADNKEAIARIADDRKQFNDAMKQLADSPEADAKVKQELVNLASRYKKYEEQLADTSDKGMGKGQLATIAAMSEQILVSANELTILFEEALKSKEVSA